MNRHSICTPHFNRKNELVLSGGGKPFLPPNAGAQVNTLQLRTKCAIHKVERADFTATGLRFLRPFDTALWLALLAGVSLVGVGILILRAVSGRAVTARFGAKSMYHAWAVFFGGDDYEWTTGPARLLRISLLFLVLISSASYTANLAAFFLMPDFEYRGPKNMADLSKSTVCFASQQWGWAAEPFARKVVYPPGDFARGKTNEELQEYCKDQLVSGNVDALCDVTGQLDTFLVQHCDDLWLVPDIDFAPSGVVWITSNDELMQNLSYAILETQSTPRWSRMAAAELNLGQTCKVELANTTPITLVHQRSVFVVFGVLLVSSLLLAVGERIVLARKSDGDPAVDIQLENQAAVNQSNRDSILKRIAAAEAELHQSIQALTASQTANAACM